MKRTGPTNPILINLIKELKLLSFKEKAPIWKRIAYELEMPTRKKRSVNLYTIDKYVEKDETAIIPGKVLSLGELTKNVTVAAFQFSDMAKEKINAVGKAISIQDLIKKNPKGKKVRIIG
ncbi:MAG: 50S ribosomal protein L18e [Candidatus Nanoarchaeia archaeon]